MWRAKDLCPNSVEVSAWHIFCAVLSQDHLLPSSNVSLYSLLSETFCSISGQIMYQWKRKKKKTTFFYLRTKEDRSTSQRSLQFLNHAGKPANFLIFQNQKGINSPGGKKCTMFRKQADGTDRRRKRFIMQYLCKPLTLVCIHMPKIGCFHAANSAE